MLNLAFDLCLLRICEASIALILLLSLAGLASENKQMQAEALWNRARDSMDIRSVDATPFRLQSRVHFLGGRTAEPADGVYMEIWSSPDRWRREIKLPDFQQTEVGQRHKRWTLRDISVEPGRLRSVRELFQSGGIQIGKVNKVWSTHLEGVQVRCIDSRIREIKQVLCFDAATGVLLQYKESLNANEYSYEYSDYKKFGDKVYPRRIRCLTNGGLALEAIIVDLSEDSSQNDPKLFEPPPGSKDWPVCGKEYPPVAVRTPDPSFPRNALANQGLSVLSLIVGTDGRPAEVKVARSAGKEFDDEAVKAVNRWRFRPAMCDGTPIPAQIHVEVSSHR
jgi:TonB family protein